MVVVDGGAHARVCEAATPERDLQLRVKCRPRLSSPDCTRKKPTPRPSSYPERESGGNERRERRRRAREPRPARHGNACRPAPQEARDDPNGVTKSGQVRHSPQPKGVSSPFDGGRGARATGGSGRGRSSWLNEGERGPLLLTSGSRKRAAVVLRRPTRVSIGAGDIRPGEGYPSSGARGSSEPAKGASPFSSARARARR